jgi:hypothetical protein
MAFFFFGTLMDRDVLEQVLARPVDDRELCVAHLPGYRRVRTARALYPMLVPDPDGVVEGVVLREVSMRDEVRIRHFEDGEYVDRCVSARLASGVTQPVRVFFAQAALGETDEPWDLARWAAEHKADFLIQCRVWMGDCPE